MINFVEWFIVVLEKYLAICHKRYAWMSSKVLQVNRDRRQTLWKSLHI